MNTCLICLEECGIYINTYLCSCRIITHPECMDKWLESNKKCLICKKSLNLNEKTNSELILYELKNSHLILNILSYINMNNNNIFNIFISIFIFIPFFLFIYTKVFLHQLYKNITKNNINIIKYYKIYHL